MLHDVIGDGTKQRTAEPGAAPADDDHVRLLAVGEPHDLLAGMPEHYGSADRYTSGVEYVDRSLRHLRHPCLTISPPWLASSGLSFKREHAGENNFGTLAQLAHDVRRDARASRGSIATKDDQRASGDPWRTAHRGPPLTFDVSTPGSDQPDDGNRSHRRRKKQPAEGVTPPPQGQVRDDDHRNEHDDQPGNDDFQE